MFLCYNYKRLDTQNNSPEESQRPDQEPLSLGKTPASTVPQEPLKSTTESPALKENIAAEPAEPPPDNHENEDMHDFESLTLRWARINAIFVGGTLFAIVITAIVFWGQWNEMAHQTDLLNIAARQARRDSAESSITTQKQLAIAQQQVSNAERQAKAAQDSAIAIQRQTEIGARPWLELSEIALTGPMTINVNGEARTTVHVVATNIGKTPAKEVSLWVELGERVTEHQEIRRLCTMSVPTPKDAGKAGQILFPTKTLGKEENQTISIKLKQFTLVERKKAGTGYQESIRLDKSGPPSSQEQFIYSIPSSVIGCIQYKSFTSDVPYYTGFIYEIYPPMKDIEMFGYNIHFDRKTGIAGDIPSTIPQENGTVTVPLEWLRLAQNRGWGNDIVK